jgi:hypothetical protein
LAFFFEIFNLFPTFLLIFLLNKASNERVKGGPSYLDERGVAPLNSDPFRTMFRRGQQKP